MLVDAVIELWLDAEEELRNGNDEKCCELKDKFIVECEKLSAEDKQYISDYLESVAA